MASPLNQLKLPDKVSAIQELKIDAVSRTVWRKLRSGLNITQTVPLLAGPDPMTIYKMRRLAVSKRLAMVNRGGIVIGHSHRECAGLFRGQ
jgi:hypothetical protein